MFIVTVYFLPQSVENDGLLKLMELFIIGQLNFILAVRINQSSTSLDKQA